MLEGGHITGSITFKEGLGQGIISYHAVLPGEANTFNIEQR